MIIQPNIMQLIRNNLKEKKPQSKCMFRLGDDDIESPYKKFLDTFGFFCIKL